MNRILSNKSIDSNIYLLSYCLLMVAALFNSYSVFNSVNGIPRPTFVTTGWHIGLGLFLIMQFFLTLKNCMYERNKYRDSILLFLIFCVALMIGFHIKIITSFILLIFILILNSNLLNYDRFVKIDLLLKISSLLLIMLMFFLRLFPAEYSASILKHGDVVRSSLGFNHPNTLGGFYLYLLISLLLYIDSRVNISNLTWVNKVILFAFTSISGIYVEFTLTNSRSSELALVIILLLLLIYMIRDIRVPKPYVGLILLLIVSFIAIGLSFFYNTGSEFMNKLNDLSSNRLLLQHAAIHQYGFGFFGNTSFQQDRKSVV